MESKIEFSLLTLAIATLDNIEKSAMDISLPAKYSLLARSPSSTRIIAKNASLDFCETSLFFSVIIGR